MANRDLFSAVAHVIEKATEQSELQSRGFVRRLLKEAGLDADDVTPAQLEVVGRKLLPEALRKNGVTDSAAILKQWLEACAQQRSSQHRSDRPGVSNTVEAVFARIGLGGRSTRDPR